MMDDSQRGNKGWYQPACMCSPRCRVWRAPLFSRSRMPRLLLASQSLGTNLQCSVRFSLESEVAYRTPRLMSPASRAFSRRGICSDKMNRHGKAARKSLRLRLGEASPQ